MIQNSACSSDILETIGQHLANDILRSDQAIDPEQNLLLDGAVDSLGMLKLVAFIEAQYKVQIPPEQFTIENFRNLHVISNYVNGLLD